MKKPFKVMSTTALTAAFAAAAVVPVQAEVVDEVETSFSGIVFDVEGVNTVVSDSDYFNALIDLEEENENELLDVIVGEDGLIKPPTYVQVGDNFYSASDYVDVVTNNEGSSLDELIQTLTSEKTPLTEEETEDFVPYEPGDGELVVESVSAITPTQVEVEFNTAVEELNRNDVFIQDADSNRIFVSSIDLAEDGKSAYVNFYDALVDETEYTLTVNVGDETLQYTFEYAEGEVAEIQVSDMVIPANEGTEISYRVLSETGVDLTETIPFSEIEVYTNNEGAIDQNGVVTLGEDESIFVELEINEVKSERFTITGQTEEAVEFDAFTISGEPVDFDELEEYNTSVKIGEDARIYANFLDQFGNNTGGAQFESLTPSVLVVDRTTGDLTPRAEGTADVRITNGEVSQIVQVEVLAAAEATTLNIEETDLTFSLNDTNASIQGEVLDQYGNGIQPEGDSLSVEVEGDAVEDVESVPVAGDGSFELPLNLQEAGEATVTIQLNENESVAVNVTVQQPGAVADYELVGVQDLDRNGDNEDADELNVSTELTLFEVDANGVRAGVAQNVEYTVTNEEGKEVQDAVDENGVLSAANLEEGTYTLTAQVGSLTVAEATFEVVDTTVEPVYEVYQTSNDITLTSGTANSSEELMEQLAEAFEITDEKGTTVNNVASYAVLSDNTSALSFTVDEDDEAVTVNEIEELTSATTVNIGEAGQTATLYVYSVNIPQGEGEEPITVEVDAQVTVNIAADVDVSRVTILSPDADVDGETNYNPNGAYRVDLDFNGTEVKDLDSLTVSLLRNGQTLAVNELSERYYNDPSYDGDTTISSPFNLGTGVVDEWSWTRGAYAENADSFDEYIPDTVRVEYVVNGISFVEEFPAGNLTLPSKPNDQE